MIKKIITIITVFTFFIGCCVFATDEEILILFDSTLSMAEDLSDGVKYQLAADATKKKIRELGNSKKVGLRTIGITLDGSMMNYISDPSSMCKATRLAVPIGINNEERISNVIDSGMPLGVTPLLYSLKTSIENDFSTSSYKHIILITDGGESCEGDACKYISELMRTRSDIKLDIIAIGASISDFAQLNCISKAANGRIYNVKSKQETEKAFNEIIPINGNNPIPQPQIIELERNQISRPVQVIDLYEPEKIDITKFYNTSINPTLHEEPKSGIIYKSYTIEVNN